MSRSEAAGPTTSRSLWWTSPKPRRTCGTRIKPPQRPGARSPARQPKRRRMEGCPGVCKIQRPGRSDRDAAGSGRERVSDRSECPAGGFERRIHSGPETGGRVAFVYRRTERMKKDRPRALRVRGRLRGGALRRSQRPRVKPGARRRWGEGRQCNSKHGTGCREGIRCRPEGSARYGVGAARGSFGALYGSNLSDGGARCWKCKSARLRLSGAPAVRLHRLGAARVPVAVFVKF